MQLYLCAYLTQVLLLLLVRLLLAPDCIECSTPVNNWSQVCLSDYLIPAN